MRTGQNRTVPFVFDGLLSRRSPVRVALNARVNKEYERLMEKELSEYFTDCPAKKKKVDVF